VRSVSCHVNGPCMRPGVQSKSPIVHNSVFRESYTLFSDSSLDIPDCGITGIGAVCHLQRPLTLSPTVSLSSFQSGYQGMNGWTPDFLKIFTEDC
jgi:hypothetical protein